MKALLTLALAAATFSASAQPTALASAAPRPATTHAAPAPDAFTQLMMGVITEQNDAATPADVLTVQAKLERAVAAAPAAWEPRYYQARGFLKLGFSGSTDEQKDKYFDQAQSALDAAKKLKTTAADQAELLVLQAYLYQGRIMVSPMTRGPVYTGRVHEALGQAKALSPDNPRVYLLLGNDMYFRPAMFGGGADKARPYYEKAQVLFALYQPATPLSPTWGAGNATAVLAKINAPATSK